MLVEVAWQAVRGPGPLRAFYERIARRRGNHIAAVAVARKLAVIVWHLLRHGEDYAWVRPCTRRSCATSSSAQGSRLAVASRGTGYAYNIARTRREERRRAEQAEIAYRRQTEAWPRRGPKVPTGAAKEERR
jgi:transposase